MKRILAAVFGACVIASPGLAQDLIAEYYTSLGAEDMRSSQGQRLGDFCAVVQQDRANFHRFGIRHDGDQSDPVFASREMRARIAGRCRIMPGSEYLPEWVLSGRSRYIWVRVYGIGGQPTELFISEGAG